MEASVQGRKRQRKGSDSDSDDTNTNTTEGTTSNKSNKNHEDSSTGTSSTSKHKHKPTRGAISRMLRGDPFPKDSPPVVKVSPLDDASSSSHLRDDSGNGNGNADNNNADGTNDEKQQLHQHCMLMDDTEKVIVTVLLPSSGQSNVSANANAQPSFERGKIYTIKVKGYIVSQANVKTCEPLLFLVAWDVIMNVEEDEDEDEDEKQQQQQQRQGRTRTSLQPRSRPHPNVPDVIQAGKAAHFLQHWAMILSNADLAGGNSSWQYPRHSSGAASSSVASPSASSATSPSPSSLRASHGKIVTDFLAHHAAVQTLHAQQQSESANTNNTSNNSNTNNTQNSHTDHHEITTRNYLAVLASFQTSQRDRQNASLTSNAGREVAARSTLVLKQYHKAVDAALLQGKALSSSASSSASSSSSSSSTHESKSLTADLLCEWHGHVCGNGVHPNAGRLRQKNVRIGTQTTFAPHQQVAADLDTVLTGCQQLEWRLLRQKQPAGITTGVATAVYAAAVHFGVLDTHPFIDGNGRTARIAANWALHRAGLPFLVQLFATPAQRTEYRQAILQTRRNLNLVGRCGGGTAAAAAAAAAAASLFADSSDDLDDTPERVVVGEEALMAAMQSAGALSPLVDLILDRMAKAITEFQKLLQEKSSLASEEAEARAARMYRERAAKGTCIICFDDNPNIATLCCGKAVHLNCIAEWLSSNSSCPQCRGDLPSLPPRMRPRQARAQARHIGGVGLGDDDDAAREDGEDEEYAEYVEHRADNNAIREILQDNVNQLRALLVDQGLDDGSFSSDSDSDSLNSSIEEDAMNEDETNVEDDPDDEDDTEDDEDLEEMNATLRDLIAASRSSHASVNEDDGDDDHEYDADPDNDDTIEVSDDAEEENEDDNTIEISDDTEEEEEDGDDGEEDDMTEVEFVAYQQRVTDNDSTRSESEEEDSDDDDTSVDAALPMPARGGRPDLPPFCHGCRNRAAKDCSNECCGKCCVLEGSLHCDRHNC